MRRPRAARRQPQAGFTLIELMVVAAIIAILAAVVIPSFMEESAKTKARSEVAAFFAEMQVRQENFKVENNVYFPKPAAATTACPATPTTTGTLLDCTAAGKPWNGLSVAPPTPTAFCSYVITSGSGTGTGNQTVAGFAFTFVSPKGPWYHISAQCDLDGDNTKVAFFTSSMDSTIQRSTEAAE